ncbi:threonine synthase [Bacillaceae bacterium]
MEIEYDYGSAFLQATFREMHKRPLEGIWKYRELLPVASDVQAVTLGEGETPLLRAERLQHFVQHERLFIKNETVNPTLSFKDRPLSVALTVARQFRLPGVVTASTGNTGVAAAAYAAKAGIPCKIFVPRGTPREKCVTMEMHGAALIEVAGTFSDAYQKAEQEAQVDGWFNLTSTFLNPYAIEGDKTLAYEIYFQLGFVPDWIVIPIGAGPLLVACYKGFKEMRIAGECAKLPRMVGVQAKNCAPIVRAFEEQAAEVKPWGQPETIASGIADPLTTYPQDGTRTLRTIRESGGCAIGVPDESIKRYRKLLAETEGVFAEPAAVTSVAAVEELKNAGRIRPEESVVCVVTGHGLKDLKI